MNTENREKGLNHLKDRLGALGSTIERHPALITNFSLLGPLTRAMELETILKSAKSGSKFIVTCQMGLIGSLAEESKAGFLGKTLNRLIESVVKVMIWRDSIPQGAVSLLKNATELIALFTIFLGTQSLGQWETIFKGLEPSDIEYGGAFYRELGLQFVLGLELIPNAFKSVANVLELPISTQEVVINCGFLLVVLLLAYAAGKQGKGNSIDILAIMQEKINGIMEGIEDHMNRMIDENILTKEESTKLARTMQLVKTALKKGDMKTFIDSVEKSLHEWSISPEELKKELDNLKKFQNKITELFNYAFTEKAKVITGIVQTA